TERGHVLAAAIYRKRAAPAEGSAAPPHALAADLAALVHSDAAPRTDAIAQQIGHELRAPVVHTAAAKAAPELKAWSMHAASQGASSSSCASTATLDRHPVALGDCVSEVRPFDDDQIALRNRCGEAVTVAV